MGRASLRNGVTKAPPFCYIVMLCNMRHLFNIAQYAVLITSKLADAVLEGKQLRENNANKKEKVEAVTAADAGVAEVETANV